MLNLFPSNDDIVTCTHGLVVRRVGVVYCECAISC